ncbi:MAG: carboxypeptidase-like regulatory domain-containing protein [Leadbetterella sp.]|nr:carboxypeptidase-like regulatory domain-containing protein [Leadbetterella sp.]
MLRIFTISLIFVSHFSFSQVSGKVVDDKNEALPGASVILFSLPDSLKVAETMTDGNGEFRLTFAGEKGLLRVSFMGFETARISYEKGKSPGEI